MRSKPQLCATGGDGFRLFTPLSRPPPLVALPPVAPSFFQDLSVRWPEVAASACCLRTASAETASHFHGLTPPSFLISAEVGYVRGMNATQDPGWFSRLRPAAKQRP